MALFGRRGERGGETEEVAQPFVERRSGVDRRRINLLPQGAGRREGDAPAEEPPSAVAAIEAAEAERFRGQIVEPAEGSILTGVVELVTRAGDTAGALRELRLEWSAEGDSWHQAVAPPDAFEVLASTAQEVQLRQVALMQSAELAERLRLALEGSDLYRRVEVRPAEASGGLAAWRGDRVTPRWDTCSVADGEYLLRLVSVDEMGLTVESEPVRLKVDNAGPEVSFQEDLSSRTLEGVEEIEVEAQDPVSGVELVALELSPDGEHWQRISEARRRPFVLRLATGELPDGRYLLRAVGRDGAGNERAAEPLAVHLRNAPAAPRLDPPGRFLRGPLELVAHASDQRTVQMIFELAASGGNEWRALGSARAPFRLAIDTRQLPDGLFDLRVEAVASGGQSTRSPRVEGSRIDNTPPTVAVLEPHTRELVSGPCEIVIEASDHGSGIERLELLRRRDEGAETLPLRPGSAGSWQCQLELEPGTVELRALARDRAGNEAEHPLALEVRTPELEPPPEEVSEQPAEPEKELLAAQHELAEAHFGAVPRWQDAGAGSEPPRPAAWGWRPSEGEDEAEPTPAVGERERPSAAEPPTLPRLQGLPVSAVLEPQPPAEPDERGNLVDFPRFAGGWDIFELAQLMAENPQQDPIRRVEREQVLYFLREHTSLDGRIPDDFDGLIRETFGELLDR